MIVHLVTNRHRLLDSPAHTDVVAIAACLCRQTAFAAEAGVDVVQVRERDLEARDLMHIVAALVARTRGTRTRVLVNDRLDVALAAQADGVHLRADSLPVAAVRRLSPPNFLVGRSVHDVREAEAAFDADYLVAGTVWPSVSKPPGHAALGLAGFAAIARVATIPVLGIGGVTVARARDIAAAGGAGIAAVGLFIGERGGEGVDGCRATQLAGPIEAMRRWFDTPGSHS